MSYVNEVKFNTHVPGLTPAGDKIVKKQTADMFLKDGVLLIRTRSSPPKYLIVPISNIEYVVVQEINFGCEPEPQPSPSQGFEAQPPPQNSVFADALSKMRLKKQTAPNDVVRMAKVAGKIVELPQDDELEVLTRPSTVAAQIAQAEESADE